MFDWIISSIWGYLALAIGAVAIFGTVYTKGNLDGRHAVQAKWDAAIIQTEKDANEARARAERDVCATADCMRKSPWNRDAN